MKFPPFRLERYLSSREFSAPLLLCCSDCETRSISDLFATDPDMLKAFMSMGLGYVDTKGSGFIRRAVAGQYRGLTEDQVLIHVGAQEAIFTFMHAMLAPDDHVVVHYPCYQSLLDVAKTIGCKTDKWMARPENNWALDIDDLKKQITDKTKLVVVNTPHNPTGDLLSADLQKELANLAEKHGFYIFGDEVYRGLEHDPAQKLPAFCEISPKAVSISVTSKAYGLAGLRLGWTACADSQVLRKMEAVKDWTSICAAGPSEFLACAALSQADRIVGENREIIRNNLEKLGDFFSRHADVFDWVPPKAGPVCFPRLKSGPARDFCQDLIDKKGVLLAPGGLFGPEYADHIRFGFGRKNMDIALDALDAYLDQRT